MHELTTTAYKLSKRILRENVKGRSYRTIAKEDYPGVKAGTLNRIAKSNGSWTPKNIETRKLLGIYKHPRYKRIQEMAPAELLWCLSDRKEMQ
jgi:hypothetical protein